MLGIVGRMADSTLPTPRLLQTGMFMFRDFRNSRLLGIELYLDSFLSRVVLRHRGTHPSPAATNVRFRMHSARGWWWKDDPMCSLEVERLFFLKPTGRFHHF
jgi:hypothetical protein